MKKTIFILLSIVLVIIICIYMNYRELLSKQTDAKQFNQAFEFYNKESIYGTDVTTVINKAIDNNEKFNIPKDENGVYKADDKNSIKIYVYMLINETTYPMESFINLGLNEFTRNFGEIRFECTDVKYHQSTGKIAEMTFAAKQM